MVGISCGLQEYERNSTLRKKISKVRPKQKVLAESEEETEKEKKKAEK
jgi:hypothetical protein